LPRPSFKSKTGSSPESPHAAALPAMKSPTMAVMDPSVVAQNPPNIPLGVPPNMNIPMPLPNVQQPLQHMPGYDPMITYPHPGMVMPPYYPPPMNAGMHPQFYGPPPMQFPPMFVQTPERRA
jgi:hypothetical protein